MMNKVFASLLLLARASCSSAKRPVKSDGPTITTDKSDYAGGETIEVTVAGYDDPTYTDWVGIWPAVHNPKQLPSPSTRWDWLTSSNTVAFAGDLCDGEYEVYLLQDNSPPYRSLAAAAFP